MPLQKRVDQLPAIASVTGPDLLILSRVTGATTGTRRVSVSQIASFFQAAGVAGPTGPAGQAGSTGVAGASGPTGPAGVAGQASTVPGPTGPTGPAGGGGG